MVILGMGTDKANKHQPLCVAHRDNQPVVVALDVEDYPIVSQKTGVPIDRFNISGRFPISITGFCIPAP